MNWYSMELKEVFENLHTSKQGLTQNEAKKRLAKYGKNEIKQINRLKPLKIFLRQFKSFIIYILIFAIILSLLIQSYLDAIVIGVLVIINSLIGFFQEYKAEKAISNLKKILVHKVIVIREGKHQQIETSEIVPGDLIVLNQGDRINADCRLIECQELQVNEAVLTGESNPVEKNSEEIKEEKVLSERKNMIYAGTMVVNGSGIGLVIATNMETEFGKIASELQELSDTPTPIQRRLDKFSKQVGIIILVLVILVMLLGFLEQFDKREMMLTALALAVSAVPNGLPAVMAIAFAISSIFMSKKNVIIRKLPSVESLGSVTVICTDKTGTLTEEKMIIQEIFSNNNLFTVKKGIFFIDNKKIDLSKQKELSQLIKTGVLASNARYEITDSGYEYIGDPTEEAILQIGLNGGFYRKELTEKEPRIKEFSFDSERKMMSILRSREDRGFILYSKGAIENILKKCSYEFLNGDLKELNSNRKKQILNEAEKMSAKALRVLGFAYKNFSKANAKEEGMIFLGIAGMIDPPRQEVKYAVEECKKAGIKIKMITGDSLLTASAIANKIGIEGKAIGGEHIDLLTESEFEKAIEEYSIFARINPTQKLKIAQALQKKGETVAMTGDGVNDVLALKIADIGIAMGKRGTDVARDVSDAVLTDDNFSSIVAGVSEGRRVYDNIKKFVRYILSVNFSEIILISVALLLKLPLPLLPLQLLWLNLVTDGPPSLALIFEKGEKTMQSKPRTEKGILDGIWKYIVWGGITNFLACFIIYLIGLNQGMTIEYIRTMVLTTGVLYELTFVYSCRSSLPFYKIGLFSNKWLNYSVLASIAVQIAFIYSGIGIFFEVVPLNLMEWLLIIPFGLSGFILFEIIKIIKNKRVKEK